MHSRNKLRWVGVRVGVGGCKGELEGVRVDAGGCEGEMEAMYVCR